MKAPQQTNHTPESGSQNTNYSMLPPDKLPNWLLEKNMPQKVYNYSMHSPDTQQQGAKYVQERTKASSVTEHNVQDNQEELVAMTSTPAPTLFADNAPGTNENILSFTDIYDADKEESPISLESNPVSDTDTPNTTENKIETEISVSENSSEPVINWQVPPPPTIQPAPQIVLPKVVDPISLQYADQQEYPSNVARPASKSLADWIFSNSNTSMIIIVGIIIFSVVLIILVVLGIV